MYWGNGEGTENNNDDDDGDQDQDSVIKNQLILTSWDKEMYLFDDDDAESRTGEQRSQPTKRHKGAINFLDFKMIAPINAGPNAKATQGLIATASDDGQIIIYNQSSHRLEGTLSLPPEPPQPEPKKKISRFLRGSIEPEMKICKFLRGSDVIVGADMAGYLNFWAITPSTVHRSQLLCRCKYVNEEEMQTMDKTASDAEENKNDDDTREKGYAYPIRGIDYDPQERMLYTGDEKGYMQKLDVRPLLDKLEQANQEAKAKSSKSPEKAGDATFLTGTGSTEKIKFSEADVKVVCCWKAHNDHINWVTWIPELRLIGSSSYDCNVYLWSADVGEETKKGKKMGSLVLGNKATAPGQEPDAETARYRKGWKIDVDRATRYYQEIGEAERYWEEVSKNYSNEKYKALKKQKENEQRKKQGHTQQEKELRNQKKFIEAKNVLNGGNSQQLQQQPSQEKDIDEMDAEELEDKDNKMLKNL